jgi:molecular chaperone GrpE
VTNDHGAGQTSGEDPEVEPRFVDKRRVDPQTGKLRQPEATAEPDAGAQDDASDAAPAQDADAAVTDDAEAQPGPEQLAADRLEQLQRLSVDYLNLQDQYSAYVKRSKAEAEASYQRGTAAMAESLIPVLDDIALARAHDDLTGPFAAIAEKLEQILAHQGLARYGEAGEEFDPAIHEALMHSHSGEVTVTTVQQVLQPGYKVAEKVLRPARVAVVDPEE